MTDRKRIRRGDRSDWLQPPDEQTGLGSYVETIRERLWIVVVALVVTVGLALIYVVTADKVYEAEAGLLVTPISSDNETLARFGLTPSIDPVRDIQTQARLITTNEVAEQAQQKLDGVPEASEDVDTLLTKVSAEPIAESNIVGVTAFAGTPEDAAAIANAFVDATIEVRTDQLYERIDNELEVLNERLDADPDSPGVAEQVSTLEALRNGPDPTLSVAEVATPPDVPVSPRPVLSLAGALLAGLVLGIGGAFAVRALDPRLRREAQLKRIYRLPILARVPRESRRSQGHALSPVKLSPAAAEAYRTLRATLALGERTDERGGRVILVTGASPSEGKTTTAISLATSLATVGNRVILIEADLRRPAIGPALNVESDDPGIVSVMFGHSTLEESLRPMPSLNLDLGLLLADYEGEWLSDPFTTPAAEELLDEARNRADYVIIDSPPLVDLVDTLPLAKLADDVLIVARLGVTRLTKLIQLGELLSENEIRPVGVVLIGVPTPTRKEYGYYTQSGAVARPGATPPRDRRPSGRPERRTTRTPS